MLWFACAFSRAVDNHLADTMCISRWGAGKENNGFDPNIQLVPSGSWGGGTGKPAPPGQPPSSAAPTGQPNASGARPAAPAPVHTFPSGGWGSSVASAAAAQPAAATSAQQTRQDARAKMDFPDLGGPPPPPKPAAPVAAAQRPGTGTGAAQSANGPAPSQPVGWAKKPEEPPLPKLDNDWAEDDDDGMDFSKPIVIKRDDDGKAVSTSPATLASDSPLDAKEAAKMLAMKKQAELAQMHENMVMQQRNQEMQAIQSEQRQMEEREVERKREMEERSKDMEGRRREQEEAAAKHRAEMEARRAEDLARREEEAKKREEAEKLRAEEREKQRQAEIAHLATQQQYMTESVQAAKLRRQEEEAAAEAERKARAEAKLAELNRRAAERQAAEEADRAKHQASRPAAPAPHPQAPPAQQLERAGMGSMFRPADREQSRPAPGPRASPWTNPHPTEVPDVEAAQWAALRKDDRPPMHDKAPADSRAGYGSGYGGISRGAGPKDGAYGNAGEGNIRGGPVGPRQLYDHKNNRFVIDDDEGLTQVRKHAQEREEREAKEREKRAAKDAARKEQAEKEAAEGLSREALKKMALEERRKREADKKAREAEVATEEIQNADPQRGSSAKGKARSRAQGNNAVQSGDGAGAGTKKDSADDAMAMPINSDFLYASSARPAVSAWTGTKFADVWSSNNAEASMDTGGSIGRGSRQVVMQFQQGRNADKAADEGVRKMQDDNEVAAKMADFLLDNDEHSPEKSDALAPSVSAPDVLGNMSSFNSGWQPGVSGVAGWSAGPGGTWDGGPFAGNPAFGGLGLLPSLSLPSHPVWDSTAGLAGEFASSQWAAQAAQAAQVPQTWSAQPQTSLQSEAMQAGAGGGSTHADKAHQAGESKKQGMQGKGKQRDKNARATKGAGQKKEGGEVGAAVKGNDKGNDKGSNKDGLVAASAEQAADKASGPQGAGRGANKGARGGHSASSTSRNKQQRVPKASGGDNEAAVPSDNREGKEGNDTSNKKPANRPRAKQAFVPPDIKQMAEARNKEKEAATGTTKPSPEPA